MTSQSLILLSVSVWAKSLILGTCICMFVDVLSFFCSFFWAHFIYSYSENITGIMNDKGNC